LFSGKEIKEIEVDYFNKNYSEFKTDLANLLIEKLEPFRRKRKELETRDVYVKEILNQGAKRAEKIAQITMQDVKKRMGLE